MSRPKFEKGGNRVIENFFRIMEVKLRQAALERYITNESFEEFSARVRESIMNIAMDYIDKTIDLLGQMMHATLKRKGGDMKTIHFFFILTNF